MKRTDPPDDEPGPALMTPRRLSGQLEALALEVYHSAGRLEGLASYVDHAPFGRIAEELHLLGRNLYQLRAQVLIGKIPVVHGEDRQSWEKRQPLLAAIEARNGGGPSPALTTNGHGNGNATEAACADPKVVDRIRGLAIITRWSQWDPDQRILALASSFATGYLAREWAKSTVGKIGALSADGRGQLEGHGLKRISDIVHHLQAGHKLTDFEGITSGRAVWLSEVLRNHWETWVDKRAEASSQESKSDSPKCRYRITHPDRPGEVLGEVDATSPGEAIAILRRRKRTLKHLDKGRYQTEELAGQDADGIKPLRIQLWDVTHPEWNSALKTVRAKSPAAAIAHAIRYLPHLDKAKWRAELVGYAEPPDPTIPEIPAKPPRTAAERSAAQASEVTVP